MKKLSYKTLYIAWAAMAVLTMVLGFAYPNAGGIWPRLISVVFFIPPWMVLRRAKTEENRFHVRLVGLLSASSVLLTLVLLVLNLMSANWSESVGNALNAALTVVSVPMVCSNFFILPLFLWGTLIAGCVMKK